MSPVVTQPKRVKDTWAKSMVLFQGDDLPFRDGLLQDISEGIGLRQRGVVKAVRPEETVLVREFLIRPYGHEVFVDHLLPRKIIVSRIPSANQA